MSHKQRVCDLMHPRSSVMDLSIAIAFYFASRGRGTMYSKHLQTSQIEKTENYETTANVLLSGLGADELLVDTCVMLESLKMESRIAVFNLSLMI